MGKFNQLSVPLIFKKIMNTGFSGELFLRGDKTSKNLFFKNGNLIFAKSTLSSEQLGEMLFVLGKIKEDEYDHLSGLAHSGDDVVSDILIQNNFITEEDLMFARLHQVRQIAISSFQMNIIELKKTESNTDRYLKDISIPLSAIIIEGVKTMKDFSLFINKIQYHAPALSYIPDPIKTVLSKEQIQLYSNLSKFGGMSNYEIIAALALDPLEYWRDLFIFLTLELIEFENHISEYDMNQEVLDLIAIRKKLIKQDIDYYQLLKISKYSELDEINFHFEQLFQKFDVENFISAISPDIKKISQSVLSKLKQVQQDMIIQSELKGKKSEPQKNIKINLDLEHMEIIEEDDKVENIDLEDKIETINLTNEFILEPEIHKKEDSVEALDLNDKYKLEPENMGIDDRIETIDLGNEFIMEPEIHKEEDHLKALDLSDEYSIEPEKSDPDDKVETIDLGNEFILEPEIHKEEDHVMEIELNDEYNMESEKKDINDKAETIDLTNEFIMKPEIQKQEGQVEAIDWTDKLLSESENLKKNDNIIIPKPSKQDETLQQAQEQYDMGLYQNVINMLRNASKKTDMKGEIYYLLGLSQSHFKDSYFEAEMNLKKAIELSPWSSGPTYALGNLYKKQGKKQLAQKCFERVMSMTANHGEAVKAVQLLMKKKNKQSYQFFSS